MHPMFTGCAFVGSSTKRWRPKWTGQVWNWSKFTSGVETLLLLEKPQYNLRVWFLCWNHWAFTTWNHWACTTLCWSKELVKQSVQLYRQSSLLKQKKCGDTIFRSGDIPYWTNTHRVSILHVTMNGSGTKSHAEGAKKKWVWFHTPYVETIEKHRGWIQRIIICQW